MCWQFSEVLLVIWAFFEFNNFVQSHWQIEEVGWTVWFSLGTLNAKHPFVKQGDTVTACLESLFLFCLCGCGLWADPCESTLWLLYVQHVLTSHLSAGEGSITLEKAHLGAHDQWTVLPLELSRWRRPSTSRIPRLKLNRQLNACCS